MASAGSNQAMGGGGEGAAPRMASAGSNQAMGGGEGAAPRMASAGSNQGIWKRGIIRMASAGSNQAMGGKGQHPAWHLRKRRGRGAMGRAPDCQVSYDAKPAVPLWGFQRNIRVFPYSMRLGDHVNGGLVVLRLRPVYRP